MSEIKFVEKEPWWDASPFTGDCWMYPTYMVKDGKEYFVFNRRNPDSEYELLKQETFKNELKENNGKYFRFYGFNPDPYDFLNWVAKRNYSFVKTSFWCNCQWSEDKSYMDFHGNIKEVSAAFKYRIYDAEMAKEISEVVGLIKDKKHTIAIRVLGEW